MGARAKRWWFHFPGEAYANNFDFEKAITIRHAKAYVRKQLKIKSLPRGTQVWMGDLWDHLP